MYNRRRSVRAGVFFGVLAVSAGVREISEHATIGFWVAMIFFGVPAMIAGVAARRDRPALVVDGESITMCRSKRVVRWDAVAAGRVHVERGLFGESHQLVLTVVQHGATAPRRFIMTNANNPSQIGIDLDWLSIPWTEVIAVIEERSGSRVITTRGRASRQ